jgi:hypothetical protein
VPSSRARSPSLVAVLCVVLAGDLGVRRLFWPLVRSDLLMPAGALRSGIDFAALFLFNAAMVLGVVIALLGLGRLLVLPSVIPRGAKAAVGMLAIAFMPLLLLATWRPLPPVLAIYLHASFTCLFTLVMLGGVLARGDARVRLGLFMVALPAALYLPWAIASLHAGRGHDIVASPTVHALAALGEGAAVVAAAASPILFLPRRPRLFVPSLATAAVVSLAAWICWRDWELARRLAAGGFGLDLPLSPLLRAGYLAALAAWTFTSVALVTMSGREALRGYGLILVGLGGFRLDAPADYAAAMVGMLTLVESVARAAAPSTTGEAWRALVKRVAAALGAPAVEIAGAEGYETARVRVTRDDETLEVALGREDGVVSHAEVVVGQAPAEEAPPVSLTRRGTPRLGRTRGDEVATGDLAFDEIFRIHDARQLSDRDRVLDDDLRPRLIHHLDGWLAVWPGAGVRYRTRNPRLLENGVEERLPGLIDLLVDVKNRG